MSYLLDPDGRSRRRRLYPGAALLLCLAYCVAFWAAIVYGAVQLWRFGQ